MSYLNTRGNLGDGHHATIVSTITASNGVERTFGMASDGASASSHSQFNLMLGNHFNFTPNLEHLIFSAKTINREAFSHSDWVLDTRAIDYMIHFISYYTSITSKLNIYVNLPNGEFAQVTHIGTVQISKKLVLHNVLCVPSFSFNLITISQLNKFVLCCLIFFGNLYFIEDLAPWSTIGLGKE